MKIHNTDFWYIIHLVTTMEKYIWYNPEKEEYEFGSLAQYEALKKESSNAGEFEIEYRFSEVSAKFAFQLTEKLNSEIQVAADK